ncbi:hypothetical protein KO525_06075 [Psychrosphaera sp. B3R10]|uniref:hypothetical protein n=1 Tax=unclassified Psychrosphaera TaxID=2641570 RepID=UPI001C089ABE|nr:MULTISPECIES: hypothetical protein [unclassified Psychrosphaera]MBU2882263.1 hypothetical protein [Psychrosphaera sp. I2R16]MBU2988944.1 hypothetical protein [Psychrosphaera sp. B3R10]
MAINWFKTQLLYRKANRYLKQVKLGKDAFNHQVLLTALELFPESTFDKLLELSNDAIAKLCGRDVKPNDETYSKQLHKLVNLVSEDEKKVKELSKFLMAFSYATGICKSDFLAQIKEDSSNKAFSLDKDVREIENDTMFKQYVSESKQALITRRELVSSKLKEKVDKKSTDFYEYFKINLSQIIAIFGFVSAIIISSGYYVNNKITESWGISTQDFFEVQDYVSTSIELISSILIYSLFFLVFTVFLVKHRLAEQHTREELNLPRRVYKIPYTLALFIVFINVSMILSLINGVTEPVYINLTLLVDYLILGFTFVDKFRIADYFKNPTLAHIILLSLLIFFINLNFEASKLTGQMNSEEYVSKYNVKIKSEISKGREFKYLMMNSNYVFLRETSNQKRIVILPKSNVIEVSPNLSFHSKELGFFEWHFELYDLFKKIFLDLWNK